MVFYECVMTAKNTTHFYLLTNIMKKIATQVVEGGGIVRGIHNHGIRDLPQRFKARYPDRLGNRYYEKGRFISMYYDSNPATMQAVHRQLRLEEEILRTTQLRARSMMDVIMNEKEKNNPYVKRVKKEEEKKLEAIRHRNETVEHVIDDFRMDDGS